MSGVIILLIPVYTILAIATFTLYGNYNIDSGDFEFFVVALWPISLPLIPYFLKKKKLKELNDWLDNEMQ